MKKMRIGIYGGTFNPPHVGHVLAAERFLESVQLDKLLIIPDFLPPHKRIDGEITAEDRLEMARLAFSHLEKAEVSDIEISRGGRSYTAVTLEELSGDDRELYFLCGTDMFLTLDEWYMPEEIFRLATICYVRRECDENDSNAIKVRTKEYVEKFNARIIPISASVKEVSSSEIRRAIKLGDARVSEFLPNAVFDYIKDRRLYK